MSTRAVLSFGCVVSIAVAIGVMAGGAMLIYGPGWFRAMLTVPQTAAPTPSPTNVPTTATKPIITGSLGKLKVSGNFGYTIVWIEETGYSAFSRAAENRDTRGMDRVLETFEVLRVPDGALVKVTAIGRGTIQIEVLGGPLAGRRGWTDPDLFEHVS